jgi:hypothetical protein
MLVPTSLTLVLTALQARRASKAPHASTVRQGHMNQLVAKLRALRAPLAKLAQTIPPAKQKRAIALTVQ